MNDTMKQSLIGLFRHVLTFGGGWAMGKGLIDQGTLDIVIPSAVAILGALLSVGAKVVSNSDSTTNKLGSFFLPFFVVAGLGMALSACTTTRPDGTPMTTEERLRVTFDAACAATPVAFVWYDAFRPILVSEGVPADVMAGVDGEVAAVKAVCASPPMDLVAASAMVAATTARVYLLINARKEVRAALPTFTVALWTRYPELMQGSGH